MDPNTTMPPTPSVSLPVSLVADVQDALLMVMTDLQRLEGLLDHATANLLERFGNADRAMAALEGQQTDELARIRLNLNQAVTELQFHDMATQLLVHTGQILKGCAWRLAAERPSRPKRTRCPWSSTPCPGAPARSRRTRWTRDPSNFSDTACAGAAFKPLRNLSILSETRSFPCDRFLP